MKTEKNINLQVRINEELKQEVSAILKSKGLSYTSMLDALFRQIIEERRIPFEIALPALPKEEPPTPTTLDAEGNYEQHQNVLKVGNTQSTYGHKQANTNAINASSKIINIIENTGHTAEAVLDRLDDNHLNLIETTIQFDNLDKTGLLTIRIHPKIKLHVSAILKEMGLSVSQTITLISKQIKINGNLPQAVWMPEAPDCVNADFFTEEEIQKDLEKAVEQIEKGETIKLEELIDHLKREGLLL